jgi:hypothetical protein
MNRNQLYTYKKNEMQKIFCSKERGVMGTFGGSEYIFQQWWNEISIHEPITKEFVNNYSTNDRFLKNRIILPEEIPFFILPILSKIKHKGYQKVVFLERGTVPYMVATKKVADYIGDMNLEIDTIRVKGIMRESFSSNLLTLASTNLDDKLFLEQPLTIVDCNQIKHEIEHMSETSIDSFQNYLESKKTSLEELLQGTREDFIISLGDFGLDNRILIPNILKTIIFKAGNWMLQNPNNINDFKNIIDEYCVSLSPQSIEHIRNMVNYSVNSSGKLSFGNLLDYMNLFIKNIRGNLEHDIRPIFNLLLKNTHTAKTLFGTKKTLFIDEISVCGSACISLELLSKAFNPDFNFAFGSIVGMWKKRSFLEVVSAKFSSFKPIEDLPYLSESYFEPVFDTNSLVTAKPHRFSAISSLGKEVKKWKRNKFSQKNGDDSHIIFHSKEETYKVRAAEIKIIQIVEKSINWTDYPIIQRRQIQNDEFLLMIINYYLSNFIWKNDSLFFLRDSISEAGLELILDFMGKMQKMLYIEIERLLIYLADWERNKLEQFIEIRSNHSVCSEQITSGIFFKTINEREQFYDRMNLGLNAIERNRNYVFYYLNKKNNHIKSMKEFKLLLTVLQKSIQ